MKTIALASLVSMFTLAAAVAPLPPFARSPAVRATSRSGRPRG